MAALELLAGYVTAPSTTPTAITVTSGTLTVRAFTLGRAFIVSMWVQGQALGYARIRAPRMHDNTQGFIAQVADGVNQVVWPHGQPQEVFSQDTLIVEKTGSATGGDIENVGVLMFHEHLAGADGKFLKLAELNARRVHVLSVRQSTAGTTDGTFSAGTALSAATSGDLLKANTEYAVLGASFSQSDVTNWGGHSLTIQGPDTGNLAVGMPVLGDYWQGSVDWFCRLAEKYDAPMIPVINSANKGGTILKVNNSENANTIVATLYLAQLAGTTV